MVPSGFYHEGLVCLVCPLFCTSLTGFISQCRGGGFRLRILRCPFVIRSIGCLLRSSLFTLLYLAGWNYRLCGAEYSQLIFVTTMTDKFIYLDQIVAFQEYQLYFRSSSVRNWKWSETSRILYVGGRVMSGCMTGCYWSPWVWKNSR